ncbi:hypothetical protein WH47_10277 [Habropoda laboriosa]|uniref:Uncharacterized protein n=1 Tax=Habropoda laboriosa TaxID=597456 RepID=A0A0L7R4K6_9HYME|nr:hypothetical protein WH47_10277 [Habropoda laboriosa]
MQKQRNETNVVFRIFNVFEYSEKRVYYSFFSRRISLCVSSYKKKSVHYAQVFDPFRSMARKKALSHGIDLWNVQASPRSQWRRLFVHNE